MEPDSLADLLSTVGRFLEQVPWYAYVAALFVIAIVFGKKREWEFEAKLIPEGSTDIVGELEIKKFKSRPPVGELELNRSSGPKLTGLVEVSVNDSTISRVEISERSHTIKIHYPHLMKNGRPMNEMFWRSQHKKWNRLDLPLDAQLRPQNNDTARVEINGETILKGVLLRD